MVANLPNIGNYSWEVDLAHEIVPDECYHKVLPSKIEIRLKKRDGIRWGALRKEQHEEKVLHFSEGIFSNLYIIV